MAVKTLNGRSKLTPYTDDLFTHGKLQLTRWQPDTNTITNIIGLPRMLMGKDAKQLYKFAGVSNRNDRRILFAHSQTVEWARHHHITLEDSPHIARAFYSDLHARRKLLEKIDVELRSSNPTPQSGLQFSLEFCLLPTRDRIVSIIGPIDDKRLYTFEFPSGGKAIHELCMKRMVGWSDDLHNQCSMVAQEVSLLIGRWSALNGADRERVVLDVFVLMTVTKSLVPVTWAIQLVPELIHEFGHLRPVYARTGPRQRRPSQRQRIWTRYLWRRQVNAVRADLLRLNPSVPATTIVSRLRRRSKVLRLIHWERVRHRRCNAEQPQSR